MIITQAAEKFNTDFPLLKYLSRYSTLIPPGSGREVSGSDVSEVLDSAVAASGCSGSEGVSGAEGPDGVCEPPQESPRRSHTSCRQQAGRRVQADAGDERRQARPAALAGSAAEKTRSSARSSAGIFLFMVIPPSSSFYAHFRRKTSGKSFLTVGKAWEGLEFSRLFCYTENNAEMFSSEVSAWNSTVLFRICWTLRS